MTIPAEAWGALGLILAGVVSGLFAWVAGLRKSNSDFNLSVTQGVDTLNRRLQEDNAAGQHGVAGGDRGFENRNGDATQGDGRHSDEGHTEVMATQRTEERFGPLPALEFQWLVVDDGTPVLQQRASGEDYWVDVPTVRMTSTPKTVDIPDAA